MAMATKVSQATMAWDQASTPGMKADIQLLGKGGIKGRPAVHYVVKVIGTAVDRRQQYSLIAWPIVFREPATMMEGLEIGPDGTVFCPADATLSCAQNFKGKSLVLSYMPSKGEIFRHALISDDHKSRVFFSIVPDPIIYSDKGCSLEAVRLSPAFELVLIRGKGFQPAEPLSFHSQSYQEVHDLPVTADSEGQFQANFTPFVKARTAGTSEVAVKGKNCSPSLAFDWGAAQ
jgi:hypothetical protein